MKPTDPMRDPNRWLVTTASGARHLIDSRDADRAVTVTRLTGGADGPDGPFWLQTLRRDEQAVHVITIEHHTNGAMRDGILLGCDMFLTLEPLDPAAAITVRRTTPVVSIEPQVPEVPSSDG